MYRSLCHFDTCVLSSQKSVGFSYFFLTHHQQSSAIMLGVYIIVVGERLLLQWDKFTRAVYRGRKRDMQPVSERVAAWPQV